MNKAKISAIIITKDEEDVIEGCLKSLTFVNEIIIIDSGSRDKTLTIAKKYTNKIFHHNWKGFAQQRNFGISKAKNKWILMIDADERVSNKLKREISKEFENPIYDTYALRRYNIFLGKLMKYGGWNPDFPVRLFKKNSSLFDEKKLLHEEIVIQGELKKLNCPLYHLSHRSIESNLAKTREYALLQSKSMYLEHYPRITITRLASDMAKHFFNRYIRAKGYKDGIEGFIEAVYQTFSQIFIIESMLWELQRDKTLQQIYQEIDRNIEKGTYEK